MQYFSSFQGFSHYRPPIRKKLGQENLRILINKELEMLFSNFTLVCPMLDSKNIDSKTVNKQ